MVENLKNFTQYLKKDYPIYICAVGETVCDSSFGISRQSSQIMALEYIAEGCGVLEINGESLRPQEGDIFFISKGSNHRYYSCAKTPWHKYWLIFDGPLADALVRYYLPEKDHLFCNCNAGKHFEKIFRIAFDENGDYTRMVDEITLELIRIFISIKNRAAVEHASMPDIIRARIDYYVERGFSLDLLCKDFNYSKNHIIYLFEEHFGKTPYQYYLERRIEVAKAYLQNSTLSIGEIASLLSYADQHYFSSCFKKAVGCPPTTFRKLSGN